MRHSLSNSGANLRRVIDTASVTRSNWRKSVTGPGRGYWERYHCVPMSGTAGSRKAERRKMAQPIKRPNKATRRAFITGEFGSISTLDRRQSIG